MSHDDGSRIGYHRALSLCDVSIARETKVSKHNRMLEVRFVDFSWSRANVKPSLIAFFSHFCFCLGFRFVMIIKKMKSAAKIIECQHDSRGVGIAQAKQRQKAQV